MAISEPNTFSKLTPAEQDRKMEPRPELFGTSFLEQIAPKFPDVSPALYAQLQSDLDLLALEIPESLTHAERSKIVEGVQHVLDSYHACAEDVLQKPFAEIRSIGSDLLAELLKSLGRQPGSPTFQPLMENFSKIKSREDVQLFKASLHEILPVAEASSHAHPTAPDHGHDHTNSNHNPTGLAGRESAVEDLREMMTRGDLGYIVLFRIGLLDTISLRFGQAAVQDCLMAVSAILVHSLTKRDTLYYWNSSTLLAILVDRVNEHTLSAEVSGILMRNRDITVRIRGAQAILRIPLTFEVVHTAKLKSPEDILNLPK